MTTDEVLASIVQKEGGFVDKTDDKGGPTCFGISSQTLGEWRRLGRPATRAEVQALKLPEAQDIYRARYIRPFDAVPFDGLKAQLVDTAVLSGVYEAVKLLQGVLGVPADGVYGDRTRTAVAVLPWQLVNRGLIAARVKFFVDIVAKDPTQLQWFHGWCVRAVSFEVSG